MGYLSSVGMVGEYYGGCGTEMIIEVVGGVYSGVLGSVLRAA